MWFYTQSTITVRVTFWKSRSKKAQTKKQPWIMSEYCSISKFIFLLLALKSKPVHICFVEETGEQILFSNLYLLQSPEGRPGMSDVSLLSGISGLSFDSPFLSPLLFFSALSFCSFCLVIFLLMVHSPDFFPENSNIFC